MPKWLPEAAPELAERLERAPSVTLFLDYDGTLAPIAATPEQARLAAPVRRLLGALSQRHRTMVISGRSLHDLRARIRLPALLYAGNHGLEMEGPGWRFRVPGAAAVRPVLEGLLPRLQRSLDREAGVRIEDKGLTASVHYRQVAPERRDAVIRTVRETVAAFTDRIRLVPGKQVLELRPRIPWHKGKAVLWVLRRCYGSRWPEATLPLYLGDDRTDRDAFRTLGSDGVSVFVLSPEARAPEAHYVLPHQGAVEPFLRWLLERLAARHRGAGPAP